MRSIRQSLTDRIRNRVVKGGFLSSTGVVTTVAMPPCERNTKRWCTGRLRLRHRYNNELFALSVAMHIESPGLCAPVAGLSVESSLMPYCRRLLRETVTVIVSVIAGATPHSDTLYFDSGSRARGFRPADSVASAEAPQHAALPHSTSPPLSPHPPLCGRYTHTLAFSPPGPRGATRPRRR